MNLETSDLKRILQIQALITKCEGFKGDLVAQKKDYIGSLCVWAAVSIWFCISQVIKPEQTWATFLFGLLWLALVLHSYWKVKRNGVLMSENERHLEFAKFEMSLALSKGETYE